MLCQRLVSPSHVQAFSHHHGEILAPMKYFPSRQNMDYNNGSIHLLGPHGVHLIFSGDEIVLFCSKDDSGSDPIQ